MMKTPKYILRLIFVSIIILYSCLSAQYKLEEIKRLGISHMQAGRYGEAIDQFNKFISANPRLAEGYNLRGLCFEKRNEYNYSVFDFRRAKAFDPSNAEYNNNLNRVLQVWHELLYQKIEGYKREIAIDPKVPWNYLEIGKCYRWLELWSIAEQWYDEYLRRDDNASPDEILRYTEILAKTRSIVKGERILKKFVERNPEDWRLWSRYGYFTYWLGKYKIAENAFNTSLGYKPFFQEALDGLDLVRNQAYLTELQPRAFEKIYPIDKYYKMLTEKPNDDETRFLLIDELVKAERFEEASQQLKYLQVNYTGNERYNALSHKVDSVKQQIYTSKIEEYKLLLKEFPENREAVRKLAEYYSGLQQYQNAEDILKGYLDKVPEDSELRLLYAQILAYDRRFDDSYPEVQKVLEKEPVPVSAKLLAGQLGVWLKKDTVVTLKCLNAVVKNDPKNVNALITLGSFYFQVNKLDSSTVYADKAKKIEPENYDLMQLYTMIEAQRVRIETDKLQKLIDDGRKLAVDKKYEEALPYYEEYMKKVTPDSVLYPEYAYLLVNLKQYDKAIGVYDTLLAKSYNYNYDRERAKLYFLNGDTLKANNEFIRLSNAKPDDIETQIFLGDTYASLKKYDDARKAYYKVRETAPPEYKIEDRIGWLPPETGSFRGIISSIGDYLFSYLFINPYVYYFGDNLNFENFYAGINIETSLYKYVSIGGSFQRGFVSSDYGTVSYSILKGTLFVKPNDRLFMGVSYGRAYSLPELKNPVLNAFINYEQKGKLKVSLTYDKMDAALMLYSPYLIENRLAAHNVKLDLSYFYVGGLKFSGYYQLIFTEQVQAIYNNSYYTFNNNIGNTFQGRIGRAFFPELYIGYEYFYSDYKYTLPIYYSPQEFSSHSLWAEWIIANDTEWEVTVGGKLGYIPRYDYIVRDINFNVTYKISKKLRFVLYGYAGDTYRNDSGYVSHSIFLSALWSL